MPNIHFARASASHEALIFKWLAEPHMREFWDNSQAHRDDIAHFIHHQQQDYFYGTTQYWLGFIDQHAFAFILSDEMLATQNDLSHLHRKHLSPTGKAITLDFGIGNTEFLGQGLAAETLQQFMAFYREQIDPSADTFFIDPDVNNPRAYHVYEKAGFVMVGHFIMDGGTFAGQQTALMVKKF